MAEYAELHCHSNFSFLDGASHPEELVEEAHRLGLSGLAITDHDGLYGVVRHAVAARPLALPTVFGAELTLEVERPPSQVSPGRSSGGRGRSESARPVGRADPPGEHLVIIGEGPTGYAGLARSITEAQMRGEKSAPRHTLAHLADAPGRAAWWVLTGCRKGSVPAALVRDGPAAAEHALGRLTDAFGRERVLIELWDHGDPMDRPRNDALAKLAARTGVEVVATNNVHYATPDRHRLATALAAIRSRRSLDELDGWLPATPFAHLRSPAEQLRRFARYPGAVERAAEVAAASAFDLRIAVPNLPDYPVPEGHTDMSWLRELTRRGASVYYPSTHPEHARAMRQIDYELDVIEQLGFPGYFLLLHNIVEFCRINDIYCQGRGSAANSAVCYALGVTKADAVSLNLLFERFLSTERDGPPDIDLDIEHQRREEVIQYVYERYGRDRAAQVANVITYRPRSALREMAKVAGLSPGHADAITKWIDRWRSKDGAFTDFRDSVDAPPVPEMVLELAEQVQDFPRHMGIHSGGMVMADRPLVECCPIEWARMEGRSVLQWDKDDCAAAGLVKFDLLGLGMLTMLHLAVDLIREYEQVEVDLATIPQEDAVYELLTAADTIGVFQVESRAQMATLPRLRPESFYDLVVEVALIRPGPIQGGSVHPYLRRRNGEEEVTYPHPLLEDCLRKTLGVPLFQEQLMQMAIDAAGFSPGEADQLRQAMGSKRSKERMARMRVRLMAGMEERGIVGDVAEEIAKKLEAFASFGFPESHSVSFAYLVYSSAWIKLHYPAEFVCGLLNAQPMGFYSPHTLVRDARRHGVEVLGPCIERSRRDCTLERRSADAGPVGHPLAGWHADPSIHAVRTGLRYVRGLSSALLDRIDDEREVAPFRDLEDFTRRTGAPVDALEALATAGAFAYLGVDRRAGLWAAGALRDAKPTTLPGVVTGIEAPTLPGMSEVEETAADLWATGMAPGKHPTEFVREQLAAKGVITAAMLRETEARSVVEIAGVVTHRQQPETANGTVFLNLEDETGLINVICPPGVWKRYRKVARVTPALRVRGLLERHQGVINVLAQRIEALPLTLADALRSRDFR